MLDTTPVTFSLKSIHLLGILELDTDARTINVIEICNLVGRVDVCGSDFGKVDVFHCGILCDDGGTPRRTT
jgi:hypothetical protein